MITRFCEKAAAKLFRMSADKLLFAAESVESRAHLSADERILLGRNKKFRDLHAGRRAFVMGNGPSLNQVPLECLKNELVFAVNGFACHEILDTWQPVALALADPTYFTKHELYRPEFEKMRTRLKGCNFFVPLAFRDTIEKFGLLPSEQCFYSHMTGNMARHRNFSVDITKPVPGGQTVTLFAILLSLYMGCNPVYLIGMDHDFLATPKNPTHFSNSYESSLSSEEKQNLSFEGWNYLKLIKAVEFMFEGYVNLKEVADKRRQMIYNATDGGYLDVFPRISIQSIIDLNSQGSVKG